MAPPQRPGPLGCKLNVRQGTGAACVAPGRFSTTATTTPATSVEGVVTDTARAPLPTVWFTEPMVGATQSSDTLCSVWTLRSSYRAWVPLPSGCVAVNRPGCATT